jgi:hypothetical protein
MKYLMIGTALMSLVACVSPEQRAQEAAVQQRVNSACEGGDMYACNALMQQAADERAREAAAWQAFSESLSDTGGYNNNRFQTTCTHVGISTTCF